MHWRCSVSGMDYCVLDSFRFDYQFEIIIDRNKYQAEYKNFVDTSENWSVFRIDLNIERKRKQERLRKTILSPMTR